MASHSPKNPIFAERESGADGRCRSMAVRPRCAMLLSLPVQMPVWRQVWLLPRIQPLSTDALSVVHVGSMREMDANECPKPNGIVPLC